MKRLDSRTVEFTDAEVEVSDYFHDLLDTGLCIRDAAYHALMPALTWVGPDFVSYLSDGTLALEAGTIVVVDRPQVPLSRVTPMLPVPEWLANHDPEVHSVNEVKPVRTYPLSLVIVAVLVAGFCGWWLNPSRAYSAEPTTHACGSRWVYEHPGSARADECRSKGWVIKYRDVAGDAALVLTPRRVASSTDLPMCKYEDGSGPAKGRPCIWWGQVEGNGGGLTYWVSPDMGIHYFWPTRPTLNGGWDWVTSEQADAFAEGDSEGAATRHWMRCVTRLHTKPGEQQVRQVKCPDGFTHEDPA